MRLRRAFIVYLLSHDRPMSEVLAPTPQEYPSEFTRGFDGMTDKPVIARRARRRTRGAHRRHRRQHAEATIAGFLCPSNAASRIGRSWGLPPRPTCPPSSGGRSTSIKFPPRSARCWWPSSKKRSQPDRTFRPRVGATCPACRRSYAGRARPAPSRSGSSRRASAMAFACVGATALARSELARRTAKSPCGRRSTKRSLLLICFSFRFSRSDSDRLDEVQSRRVLRRVVSVLRRRTPVRGCRVQA